MKEEQPRFPENMPEYSLPLPGEGAAVQLIRQQKPPHHNWRGG